MKKFKEKEYKLEKRRDQSLKKAFSNFIKVYASNFDLLNDQNQ